MEEAIVTRMLFIPRYILCLLSVLGLYFGQSLYAEAITAGTGCGYIQDEYPHSELHPSGIMYSVSISRFLPKEGDCYSWVGLTGPLGSDASEEEPITLTLNSYDSGSGGVQNFRINTHSSVTDVVTTGFAGVNQTIYFNSDATISMQYKYCGATYSFTTNFFIDYHVVDGFTVQSVAADISSPVLDAPTTMSVAENQTAIVDLAATDDASSEDCLAYSLTGGADQALFDIADATGCLLYTSPSPRDA